MCAGNAALHPIETGGKVVRYGKDAITSLLSGERVEPVSEVINQTCSNNSKGIIVIVIIVIVVVIAVIIVTCLIVFAVPKKAKEVLPAPVTAALNPLSLLR
jgi:heme/copper-type cytochrome/quinol oxidase subunit 2